MRPIHLAPLLIGLLFSQPAFAQQDSTAGPTIYRITLKDGSEVVGTIQAQDSSRLEFLSLSKIAMSIPRDQIESIVRRIGNLVGVEYPPADPNYTRLFFAPTGRALKNGQGYFSAYEIFFPFLAVGIGDIVTLAGGISLIPGADNQIIYLAPKITPLHLDKLDVSAGLLYISTLSGNSTSVGIVYGVGTYGTSNAALTAGLGWGFAEGEFSSRPIVLIGGELRVLRSIKIITENWIPPGTDVIIYSFGLRFFGEGLAADLGFIHPSTFGGNGFPFIPWIGFAYNFGAK